MAAGASPRAFSGCNTGGGVTWAAADPSPLFISSSSETRATGLAAQALESVPDAGGIGRRMSFARFRNAGDCCKRIDLPKAFPTSPSAPSPSPSSSSPAFRLTPTVHERRPDRDALGAEVEARGSGTATEAALGECERWRGPAGPAASAFTPQDASLIVITGAILVMPHLPASRVVLVPNQLALGALPSPRALAAAFSPFANEGPSYASMNATIVCTCCYYSESLDAASSHPSASPRPPCPTPPVTL
ncbi:hypothetical protein R3P38DRAFT_1204445 [Favolaschia claudopus]|uniref:Uncharacterized protein n=1 Tax=Favolaschia claudopus TaxID=2862362 RepID=A0AAW0B3P4_9AGAR